ncbi:MAG: VWA domain-containing protein [Treponema sp.]|jgi:hypothetical protein|nr:VWA domain-containing protein [Treponema sp.]
MQKYACLGLVYLWGALCFAQQRPVDYIDEAVFKAARYLEERLPPGARVILVNDPSKEAEEAVFHPLESTLVNADKLDVFERNARILHLIQEELDFQYSGEVRDDTLAALGHKIGAQYIVLISVHPQAGASGRFRVKAVHVETAQIRASQEYPFQRQVAVQSRVVIDYRLNQLSYGGVSQGIGPGDVYLGLGFRIASDLDIRELSQEHIEAALSSAVEPKNICLVIDISGSMNETIDQGIRKIDWVKRELERYFRNTLHVQDVISAIAFTDTFQEIIPSMRIENEADREWCIGKIKALQPGGNTRIAPPLRRGYALLTSNKKDAYINRVILITDGLSNDREEVKNLVAEHKNTDIATFSTVALCLDDASRTFMLSVADLGGGFFLPVDARNAAKPMDKALDLLATAVAATIKNKEHRLDIKLSAPEGLSFTAASGEQSGLSPGFAHYRLELREGEHKIIWLKAALGPGAVQGGSIADLAIASGSLLARTYHIPLKAPDDVTSYDKTRILGVYQTL